MKNAETQIACFLDWLRAEEQARNEVVWNCWRRDNFRDIAQAERAECRKILAMAEAMLVKQRARRPHVRQRDCATA
jgi:hypothetical protein